MKQGSAVDSPKPRGYRPPGKSNVDWVSLVMTGKRGKEEGTRAQDISSRYTNIE